MPNLSLFLLTLKGGPGSGNHDHSGRPGKHGGSSPKPSNLFGERKWVTDDDIGFEADYGKKAGTYIAYRVGPIQSTTRKLTFLSANYGGAVEYGYPEDVKAYAVTIQKPFVTTNIYNALAKLTGENAATLKKQHNNSSSWLRDADNRLHELLVKNGYDSVVFTKPTPPADREIAVVDYKMLQEIPFKE